MSPTRQIAFTALLLTLPLTSIAMLGVEKELSVTVPGLQHNIVVIDCRDINSDGVPEILAADDTCFVLYDPTHDSILFTDLLAGCTPQKILLADIDRDGVADLTVAGQDDSAFQYIIRSYDGTSGYATIDSLRQNIPYSFSYEWGTAIRGLSCGDYDFDGATEFLLSFDLMAGGGVGTVTMFTSGKSLLYERFPDSLTWERSALLSGLQPLTSESLNVGLRTYNYYTDIGQDHADLSTYPVVVSASGTVLESPPQGASIGCPDPYYGWSETSDYTYSLCAGNIDATTPETEVASSTRLSYSCSLESGEYSSEARYVLTLARLVTPDSSELVWVHHTPELYCSLLCYPDSSGYFFAMLGNALVQVRGSDGIELNRSDPLPSGTKFWAYPIADSIPRLVNYDGNQVSFYRLDQATSINEEANLPLPTTFTLGQPYPNPFNPTTIIPLNLPRRADIRVEAFNLLGQKVGVIFEESLSAGDHTITWDASGLPSGIYFVRASSELGERAVKALMLK